MRRTTVAFVFVTVLLDVLSLGIIIPVLPHLIQHFYSGDTARSAHWLGWMATLWALMQFLFSPLLGAVSDHLGRRPVILASSLGLSLDYLLMAWAPSVQWLLLGRIISGITSASLSTAFAYVADLTPAAERASRFGLLGAAFGVGFVVGPAFGGLLGSISPRLPFWVAGALSLLNTLYGFFVLPESLPRQGRPGFSWLRANPVGSLALLMQHQHLARMASVHFLSQLAHTVLPSVTVLYMSYRYGWNEKAVGMTLAFVGICSLIVQGMLVRPIVSHLGEGRTLVMGLCCGALGFSIYASAPSGWTFLLGIPIMSLWGLCNPALQALMSSRVGPHLQGQLQGANSSLTSMAGLVGPLLFTFVFAWSVKAPHAALMGVGAPYIISASLVLAGAFIARQLLSVARIHSKE